MSKKKKGLKNRKQENIPLGLFRKTDYIVCVFIFIITFIVYIRTLCPSLYVGDSGELISASYFLGIPHPPGYPIYCLLGKLFTFLPISNIAYRVNLMSAFFASLSCAIMYLILRLWNLKSWIAGFSCCVAFGFSYTLWSQSVIAEVYTLNLFFIVITLFLICLWQKKRQDKYLYIFSFLYGLSLTHHYTMFLYGPVYVLFIMVIEPKFLKDWRRLLKLLGLSLLGLSFYFYIYIRANSQTPVNWANPDTLEKMMNHILRRQYGSISKFPHTLSLYARQVFSYIKEANREFAPFVIWTGFLGSGFLFKKSKLYFLLSLAIYFMLTFVLIWVINFEVTQHTLYAVEIFYIPSYIVIAMWLGFLFDGILKKLNADSRGSNTDLRRLQNSRNLIISITILLFPLIPLKTNFWENDRSKNWIAHNYGLNIFKTLPKNSIFIADGDNPVFITCYMQKVLGLRPDVTVHNKLGVLFEDIYGDLSGSDVERERIWERGDQRLFEEEKIYEPSGSFSRRLIYFAWQREMKNIEGFDIEPAGILYKVKPKGQPQSNYDKIWDSYDLSGVDDTTIWKDNYVKEVSSQYHYRRGDYLMQLDRVDEAKEEYKKTSLIAGDVADIHNNIGLEFMHRGEFDKAMEEYERAQELSPETAEIHYNMGLLYKNMNQPDKAEEKFKKSIELKPSLAKAYESLADLYREKKEVNLAIEFYRKAISVEPTVSEARVSLANLLKASGDADEVERLYIEAIKFNPHNAQAHYNLGVLYYEQGFYGRAETQYKKAIKANLKFSQAHNNLGTIYKARGLYKEAIGEFKKAIKVEPSNAEAYYNLAVTYEESNKNEEAIKGYEEFIRLWKGDSSFLKKAQEAIDRIRNRL